MSLVTSAATKYEKFLCFPNFSVSVFQLSQYLLSAFSQLHSVPVNSQAHFCLARDLRPNG
jgi:hypothetical protein